MELLSRLRRAVKKLTFLINLKNYLRHSTLRLASLLRARAPATITAASRWPNRRAISFNDRPGLRACVDLHSPDHYHHHYQLHDDDDYDGDDEDANGGHRSEGGSSGATSPYRQLRRTTSYPLEEDVDKRAEMFIANFYKQLQYERQISLELRYCRGTSLSSSSAADSDVSLSLNGSHLVSPT